MARDGLRLCTCPHMRREHFQYGPCRQCDCKGFVARTPPATQAKRLDWDHFMIAMNRPGGGP